MFGWYIFGSLSAVLGFVIISSNTIVVLFYYKKRKEIIPLMYTIIAICDTITGLVTFVHSVILFSLDFESINFSKWTVDLNTSIEWLICISSVVTTITLRSSIFFNVVLIIIRTINITRPFKKIRKRAVLACICIYSTILAAGALADVISHLEKQVDTITLTTKIYLVSYSFLLPLPNFQFVWLLILRYPVLAGGVDMVVVMFSILGIIFLTMALPALISVICSIIQVVYLLKNNAAASNNTTLREAVQKQMTVTILLLTTLCFICNLPYTCHCIYTLLFAGGGFSMKVLYSSYFMSTLLPFINAAMSPLLLILRGKALREFIWQKAEVFKNTLIAKETQTVVTTI